MTMTMRLLCNIDGMEELFPLLATSPTWRKTRRGWCRSRWCDVWRQI